MLRLALVSGSARRTVEVPEPEDASEAPRPLGTSSASLNAPRLE